MSLREMGRVLSGWGREERTEREAVSLNNIKVVYDALTVSQLCRKRSSVD